LATWREKIIACKDAKNTKIKSLCKLGDLARKIIARKDAKTQRSKEVKEKNR